MSTDNGKGRLDAPLSKGETDVRERQMEPAVGVVILNWNRSDDTLACIDSVKRSRYPVSHIVVVDNASRDSSAARISQAHPDAVLIENKENIGFAGGNNRGIAFALGHGIEYVLVLNNDATVEPDTIGELVRCASRDPRIAAVGAKIFRMDRPEILNFCYGAIRYHHWFVTVEGLDAPDNERFCQERNVEWISGCCMLMTRDALMDIGAFDEDFFAYLEDVDWCLRARKRGYRVLFCPGARAHHKGSASTGRNSPQINYFYGRNCILFLKKHGSTAQWARFLSAFAVVFLLRLIKAAFSGGARRVLYSLAGLYDGFLNREPRYGALALR